MIRLMPLFVLDGKAMMGLPALAEGCTTNEVHLATPTPENGAGTNGIGTHLAGKIYFDRTVDCRHARVLCDHRGIVHVGNVEHDNHRVVINEVIDLAGPHHEGRHDLTRGDVSCTSR